MKGYVSKDDYAAALRGHQAVVDETKSEQRDAAEATTSTRHDMYWVLGYGDLTNDGAAAALVCASHRCVCVCDEIIYMDIVGIHKNKDI